MIEGGGGREGGEGRGREGRGRVGGRELMHVHII
jgi:hypothetical protein